MDYKYVILSEERERLFQECIDEAPTDLRFKVRQVKRMEEELMNVMSKEFKKANSGGLFRLGL